MSYWSKYFFNDRKYWSKFLITGVGFLILIDLLSYIFNPPGYFRLWPLIITVFISIPVLARIIYVNFRNLKRIRRVEAQAPEFEKTSEARIREIIKSDPEFTTFCYECTFFNEETRACGRDRVYERVKEIRSGHRTYCLYWEKKATKFSTGYPA